MSEKVEIYEVGPRDGLQNEPDIIETSSKVALIDLLSQAGYRRIEATSFVSPKWVPQMGDSADVMTQINRAPGVRYAALTPNMKGYDAAREAKVDEIAVFASASEGFSKANTNASIAENLGRFVPIIQAARADDIPVRGYVSCVVECPYDGAVSPDNVAHVAADLYFLGCSEISLGDTIGKATPEQVDAMLGVVVESVPAEDLAGHFHDTNGRALDNVEVGLSHGLRVFDASVGGLGGCPYAPGAAGNVATEAVLAKLTTLGYETGLDAEIVARAAELAREMSHV